MAGTAQGIGRSAIGGALDAGGRAVAVLPGELSSAVLDAYFIPGFASRKLVACSPWDPVSIPDESEAAVASRLLYTLADTLLVVDADDQIQENVARQLRYPDKLAIFVCLRDSGSTGLAALRREGAALWPDPRRSDHFRQIMESEMPEAYYGLYPPEEQESEEDVGLPLGGEAQCPCHHMDPNMSPGDALEDDESPLDASEEHTPDEKHPHGSAPDVPADSSPEKGAQPDSKPADKKPVTEHWVQYGMFDDLDDDE